MIMFCINTSFNIIILFESPQLTTLDNQDLSVMCFARAFYHNTLWYGLLATKGDALLLCAFRKGW